MAQITGNVEKSFNNLEAYTLATLAVFSGILWTLYTVYVSSGGRIFIFVLVFAILFSGFSAYLTESYAISILLGLLPIYGAGVGEVIAAPYHGPILLGIINLLLLFSIGGVIISTAGFLIGIITRYKSDIIDKKRWLALRVGASVFICLALYVAARNNWISYSVTV
jgi:hypothetical protein